MWEGQDHIVTKHHVIDGARKLFVRLDAGQLHEACILGRAPEYDLAVVRLLKLPRELEAGIGNTAELVIRDGVQRKLKVGVIDLRR